MRWKSNLAQNGGRPKKPTSQRSQFPLVNGQRGEVRKQSDNQAYSKAEKPGPADIGVSPKDIHEARIIRDAEKADPGIIRRTLDQLLGGANCGQPNRRPISGEPPPTSTCW